jgi:hypothetical protein
MVRFGRHMTGEIVDVIQRQLNNQVRPASHCSHEAGFHLAVDQRPFDNQVSLLRRQPDVHELSGLDPLAPHRSGGARQRRKHRIGVDKVDHPCR